MVSLSVHGYFALPWVDPRGRLNFYVETVVVQFMDGRLAEVSPGQGSRDDVASLTMPPLLLAPLALGYRSFDELSQAYHDVSANPAGRVLADLLFPKVALFIYTIY